MCGMKWRCMQFDSNIFFCHCPKVSHIPHEKLSSSKSPLSLCPQKGGPFEYSDQCCSQTENRPELWSVSSPATSSLETWLTGTDRQTTFVEVAVTKSNLKIKTSLRLLLFKNDLFSKTIYFQRHWQVSTHHYFS